MKKLSHQRISAATILVWELLAKGLDPTTIAEKLKVGRRDLWRQLDALQKGGYVAKTEKLGRSWQYRILRRPSIVASRPATLDKIVAKPFYLPHNVSGFFEVIGGEIGREGKDAIRYWLQARPDVSADRATVHLEFSVEGCGIDFSEGPTGKKVFRVDVPEPLINAPSVAEAQREALALMRAAALRFCAEKRLELGEGAPFKTTFPEWVQQRKALSKQVIEAAELKRASVLVETPEGPDLVMMTLSHFGDEQHTGPGAAFGAKQGELLWKGEITASIRLLSRQLQETVSLVKASAELQQHRASVVESKLQELDVNLERTIEGLNEAVKLVGRRR